MPERGGPMLGLHALTIFVGATLLFLVQPMFARFVLPLLGGSPAVWNTAMVFYQAALLAGYAYVHLVTTRLSTRGQVGLHALVLLAPLATLPLAVPAGWTAPGDAAPAGWLLGLMAVAVGPAFFAVATTSPLVQRWFADSGGRRAADPYFLYAASNAGSMLALIAYPVVVEPQLRLLAQSRLWTWGYIAFVVLIGACAAVAWRRAGARVLSNDQPRPGPGMDRIRWPQRTRWVLLSLVPSGLLLGVTSFISSDIAVIPLMWVVPLGLYLLTFILAFAPRPVVPRALLARTLPILFVPLIMAFNLGASSPAGPMMVLHLATFFVASLLCHDALARSRPPPSQLTGYYLWMSFGGMLGGVVTALLAPVLFDAVIEYPLMLVLACLVGLPNPPATGPATTAPDLGSDEAAARERDARRRQRLGDWAWPLAVGLVSAALIHYHERAGLGQDPFTTALVFGVPVLAAYFLSRRPLRFALAAATLLITGVFNPGESGRVLHQERSFFGVHRVTVSADGAHRMLVHGRTLHGRQGTDPARSREPLTYYHRSGPVGQVAALYARDPASRVAVIGLGAGSVAAYAQPGQAWTYYEIDPVVRHLAGSGEYFTFLRDSAGRSRIVLGDARVSLAREPGAGFDLMILDAYSSDAIPVHLVTREAIALYLDKLAPGGVLAFHVSNLHLDLEPVFANLARDAGLAVLTRDDTTVTEEERRAGKSPSVWMVMARRPEALAPLASDSRWQRSRGDDRAVWTDDYSSLLGVMRWR